MQYYLGKRKRRRDKGTKGYEGASTRPGDYDMKDVYDNWDKTEICMDWTEGDDDAI